MRNQAFALFLSVAGLFAQQSAAGKSPDALRAEAEAIRARLELTAARQRLAAWPMTAEVRRLETEAALRAARAEAAAAQEEAERTRLTLDTAVAALRATVAASAQEGARAELEAEARLATAQLSVEHAKVAAAVPIARLRQKAAEIAADARMTYPADPMVGGVLHISDRRIPFNGRITNDLAAFVCGRLAFFNAVDDRAPIFIVIDRNPGGSVMAGYMILQAMEASRAPVYVVVKGYAASMAAIITTLAKRSFVYPEAVVLHHQASSGLSGNLTQLNEQLRWSKLWCDRIFSKVAAKVGLPLDEFVARMYQNASTGDWRVKGDVAVRLKWASDLTERIVEDSATSAAAAPAPSALDPEVFGQARPTRGPDGRLTQPLPPLGPGDVWWLYDPSVEYVLL